VKVELVHNRGAMGLNGLDTYPENVRDAFVAVTIGDHLDDGSFPAGQKRA